MKMKPAFFIALFLMLSVLMAFANTSADADKQQEDKKVISQGISDQGIKYIAASLSVAIAAAFSGIAIGRIGSAAMGAISEKPEAGGTAIILAALAEGVCLWGIAGAALIIFF